MNKYLLSEECNDDNVKKSLQNNLLGNNEWLANFVSFLTTIEDGVIALDGKWGSGKTFLAKEIKEIINKKYNYFKSYLDNINYIKDVEVGSYFSIYYDAWEYDNDVNPMISFLYYLNNILKNTFKGEKIHKILKNLLLNFVEKVSDGWFNINKIEEAESIIETKPIITLDTIRNEIKELLKELRSEKCNTLVIIIDELDRCRPEYTLKFLETINHYLKIDGILILVTFDMEQLSNIIKTRYGNETNTLLYLDKFFDFKFDVPEASIENYVKYKLYGIYNERNIFECFAIEIFKEKKLTLRNIDHILSYLKPLFKSNENINFYKNGILYFWPIYYFYALLFDHNELNRLLNKNYEEISKLLNNSAIYGRLKDIYGNKPKNSEISNEKYVLECFENDIDNIIDILKGNIDSIDYNHDMFVRSKILKKINLLSCMLERKSE